jgi:hypothetical protein
MKNLLRYTLFLCLCFSATNGQAQSKPADPLATKNVASANVVVTAKSALTPARTVEEARNRFMALFNLYRDYSISFDTDALLNEKVTSKNPQQDIVVSNFGSYLEKMTGILNKKMEKVTTNTAEARAERSHYLSGLNTLKSAKCLQSDDQKRVLATTKDAQGNALMAFELDGIRGNSRYGLVENYHEGFSRIRKDQVYGYLNLCGDEVITCQYERAEPFNAGRALVKRVDWYFVDGEGNESEALENVAEGKTLKQGIYLVRTLNGKQAFIDNNYDVTKVPLSQLYDGIDSFYHKDVFKVRNNKKTGLISLNGKTIFDAIYDNVESTNLSGIYRINQNKGIGLLDTTWAIRTSPTYDAISDFNSFGLATARNAKGTAIIRAKDYKMSKFYVSVSDYNEFGVSTVKNEGNLYGLIDSNLNVIVAPKYSSIGFFNEIGLAPACYPDGKCGFIKYDGTEQIKANYEAVGTFNTFGLMVARTAVENCGQPNNAVCKADVILDRTGNVIVPVNDESIKNKFHYELTDSLRDDRFIVVNVKEDKSSVLKGFLLIQKDNLQLITSTSYQEIKPMDVLGNIRVNKNGKWGIIDSMGRTLAKPLYKEIRRVNDSYYPTQHDNGKWGYLNKKGKPQIPFEYEEVRSYRFGFAPVSKGKGRWGLINRFNAKVVPCAFRSVNLNQAETKFEITDDDNIIFIINEQGDCETNCPKFEDLRAKANKAAETTTTEKR